MSSLKGSQSSLGRSSWIFNTTSLTNSSSPFSKEDLLMYPEYEAFNIIWHYCPPVLLGVGLPGNVLTIVVLRRMWNSGSHQFPFLVSLACADFCLLVCGLLFDMCFYIFGYDLMEFHVVPCKVLTFLMNSSSTVSAWLLVAVTTQRAVSVIRPHRVATCFSTCHCCFVLVVLVFLSCLLQLHVLVGEHVPGVHPEGFCTPVAVDHLHVSSATAWTVADLLMSCVLPSLLLPVCNAVLIQGLRSSERTLRSLSGHSSEAKENRRRLASSMTTALPFLSLSFFCLSVPIYCYVLWSHLRREEINADPRMFARAELAWAVTNMLWYANSTVNFLLYCLSGKQFRKELLLLVRCRSIRKRHRQRAITGRVRFESRRSRDSGGVRVNTVSLQFFCESAITMVNAM